MDALEARFSRLKFFFKELKRLPNLAIIFGAITYYLIWGYWGWNDYELYSSGWRFDLVGHAIGGMGAGFALFYIFRTYPLGGYFRISGAITLRTLVIAIIVIGGFAWELIEFSWDKWGHPNFPWVAPAQKGQIDTMVDWIVTVGGGILSTIIDAVRYRRLIKRHPEIYEAEEIEELRASVHEQSEKIARRQRAIRRKKLQHLFMPLKREMDKLFSDAGSETKEDD